MSHKSDLTRTSDVAKLPVDIRVKPFTGALTGGTGARLPLTMRCRPDWTSIATNMKRWRFSGSCLTPYRREPSFAQPYTGHSSSSRSLNDLPSGAINASPPGVLHAIHRLSGDHCGCVNGAMFSRMMTGGDATPTRALTRDQPPGVPRAKPIHAPSGDHVGA